MLRQGIEDIGVALALLTRLPLPRLRAVAFDRQAQSGWAWPLAGALTAGLAAIVGLVALGLGLPPGVAALLIVTGQIALTGAMHEDGLADTADGVWGGWDRDRRLDIMKDSRIGTYGVLALILATGLRWTALTALLPLGGGPVIVGAVLSRACLPALMRALPNARAGGLSHTVGTPPFWSVLVAIALALSLSVAAVGSAALAAAGAVAVGSVGVGALALRKIGGQTGDILGATQQITEILALLALLCVMA